VLQDTGFSEVFPVGRGIVAFSNLEEALAAINEVETNYSEHQEAARELARTHFSSEVVLSDLLGRIGL
jgi:prefoldin subunit 5